MTRSQWLIIGGLTVGVILVFSVAGVLAISTVQGLALQQAAAPTEQVRAVSTATPAATATPRPTATPEPTATWVFAPRSVATPAAGTRVSGPLQDAWDKTSKAKSYRFEFDLGMKGDLGSLYGGSGGVQEMSLLMLSGEANGRDSHYNMKGWIAAFMGADPTKGLEMTSLGDKVYVRGPAMLLGAPEAKWYVGSGDRLPSGSGAQPNDMVTGLRAGHLDWGGFNKGSSETLDGKRCDVYTGDRETSLRFFGELASLGGSASMNQYQLSELDNAETRVWVCSDGHLHQLRISLEGSTGSRSDQTATIMLRMHIYDQDASIKITAPPNAVPLQAPSLGPTPTRTPGRAVN